MSHFRFEINQAMIKRLEPRFKGPETGFDVNHFRGYIGKLAGNDINFRFELIEPTFKFIEPRIMFVALV